MSVILKDLESTFEFEGRVTQLGATSEVTNVGFLACRNRLQRAAVFEHFDDAGDVVFCGVDD